MENVLYLCKFHHHLVPFDLHPVRPVRGNSRGKRSIASTRIVSWLCFPHAFSLWLTFTTP